MKPARLLHLWNANLVTGIATYVTLSHRLPLIAAESVAPTKAGQSEMQTMVTEKLVAAHHGFLDASVAAWKAGLSAATKGMTPYGAFRASEKIVDAALRPAGNRVRANARRLSRKA